MVLFANDHDASSTTADDIRNGSHSGDNMNNAKNGNTTNARTRVAPVDNFCASVTVVICVFGFRVWA